MKNEQAEPVGYFVNDESDDQWHQVNYEQRNGADTYPLYLHPPADEVQRLRVDAEKKDALLVRAHDMLGYIGCSPEGAENDIRMAEELQRDIDAARSEQGSRK